jgi:hypothetical protein
MSQESPNNQNKPAAPSSADYAGDYNRETTFGRGDRNYQAPLRAFGANDWRSYGENPSLHNSGEGIVERMRKFLVGPKLQERDPGGILADVNHALFEDPRLDASQVEVRLEDGIVTLEGAVTDRWSKWRAEDSAEAVSGVKEVVNYLRVTRDFEESRVDPDLQAAAALMPGNPEEPIFETPGLEGVTSIGGFNNSVVIPHPPREPER